MSVVCVASSWADCKGADDEPYCMAGSVSASRSAVLKVHRSAHTLCSCLQAMQQRPLALGAVHAMRASNRIPLLSNRRLVAATALPVRRASP